MSLVQGLENMVRDIESHHGELLPTLADPKAFEVGGTSRPPKAPWCSATA